jgi:hypothetical protein
MSGAAWTSFGHPLLKFFLRDAPVVASQLAPFQQTAFQQFPYPGLGPSDKALDVCQIQQPVTVFDLFGDFMLVA